MISWFHGFGPHGEEAHHGREAAWFMTSWHKREGETCVSNSPSRHTPKGLTPPFKGSMTWSGPFFLFILISSWNLCRKFCLLQQELPSLGAGKPQDRSVSMNTITLDTTGSSYIYVYI